MKDNERERGGIGDGGDRQTDRPAGRQAGRQADIQTETETERQRERGTQIDRQTVTDRQTDRKTKTETDRKANSDIEKEGNIYHIFVNTTSRPPVSLFPSTDFAFRHNIREETVEQENKQHK